MSNLLSVIQRASELEKLLTEAGGQGTGLGEKARSLEGKISAEGTQAAKSVSWLRNRCAHDAYEPSNAEMRRFNMAADQLAAALQDRRKSHRPQPHRPRSKKVRSRVAHEDAWATLNPLEKLSVRSMELREQHGILFQRPDSLLGGIPFLLGMLFLLSGVASLVAVLTGWYVQPNWELPFFGEMSGPLFLSGYAFVALFLGWLLLNLSLWIDTALYISAELRSCTLHIGVNSRAGGEIPRF